MSDKLFFTAGPSQLYPTVKHHISEALDQSIPSISHRSQAFRDIYKEAFENLQELLDLPKDYAVLFTGSASEIWERLLFNLVQKGSFHLVNGAFSQKFYEYAASQKKNPVKQEAAEGEGFDLEEVLEVSKIVETAEMIALTHNESSTGVMMPSEDIQTIYQANPDKLITVDVVSSCPYPKLDYTQMDSAYFSVQKGFGLPAGLGVWLVNKKCLERAQALEEKGAMTGSHHRLTELWQSFEKYETPATPNVLGIYLLAKVAKDMLNKGIDTIRKETEQKAEMLFSYLENSPLYNPSVLNPAHQSKTVIVADTEISAIKLVKTLEQKNIFISTGYKHKQDQQIRIANFPAISIQQMEHLIRELDKF